MPWLSYIKALNLYIQTEVFRQLHYLYFVPISVTIFTEKCHISRKSEVWKLKDLK